MAPETTSITISSRFRGPPASGNGGYSSGLVANLLGGAGEVTLRKPPPLDRSLVLERGERVLLRDGDEVIAEGRPSELGLDVPAPPSFEDAEARVSRFAGFESHIFPECFVCGPRRDVGDGLRIFPGRAEDERLVAAPWIPHPSLRGASESVAPEILWAALDCPGYFAIGRDVKAVLGRMTGHVAGTVRPGERCVVVGWSLGEEGRKLHTATALFSETGALVGRSRQIWVKLAG